MKVQITEYLRIDLTSERWECRRCNHQIGNARQNYKQGLLVYDRDPREIHPPLLDPKLYARTYSPDPNWCRILEYYCPNCGTMVEVEYLPAGHPPLHDIDLDIDALKVQWKDRPEIVDPPSVGDPALDARRARVAHRHGH
jgi:acetone carboxylase, gamma subunit